MSLALATRNETGYKDRQTLELEIFMYSWEPLSDEETSARAGAIEILRYFPVREQFWLEQLEDVLREDVVFICGDYHVDRIKPLLNNKGIEYQEVIRGLGVTDEDRQQVRIAEEYLEAHKDDLNECGEN